MSLRLAKASWMVKEIWEPVTERLGGDSHPCRTYYKSPRPAECGREAGRDVAAALIEVSVRNDVFGEAIKHREVPYIQTFTRILACLPKPWR